MKIDYYKTYIQTIKNALGSNMFRSFFIGGKDGSRDILNDWSVSCAYFVSNILKQFNLTSVWRANVGKVIDDLHLKWRQEIAVLETRNLPDNIPVGSVLVWEASYGQTYDKMHQHIGFYVWDGQAISNNSIYFTGNVEAGQVPVQHHYTYQWQRKLTHVFTWNWEELFSEWLYHYEMDIPYVSGVWEENLRIHGFDDEAIDFWLGKKENLHYGKLCGLASIVMCLRYFLQKDILISEWIIFANEQISYINSMTQEQKIVTCYTPWIGRYHSWLLAIADHIGKKYWTQITGSVHTILPEKIEDVIKDTLKQDVSWKNIAMIASVTLWFDAMKDVRWGHLVVVLWLDYNGYEHTVIVHDPAFAAKQYIPLSVFIQCFSGKYIVVRRD